MLTCGIIGLPLAGKTTIYNSLTCANAQTTKYGSSRTTTHTAAATVPDQRIDHLSSVYHPKKTAYATVAFSDVPGLTRGAERNRAGNNPFLEGIRQADVLVHVIRAFRHESAIHPEGSIDPGRDIETVDLELLLSDMELMDNRLTRLAATRKPSQDTAFETDLAHKCLSLLESGVPLGSAHFTAEERLGLARFQLLTTKPQILVVNIDDQHLRAGTYPGMAEVEAIAAATGRACFAACGPVEAEIRQLDAQDQGAFLEEYGLDSLGVDRLTHAAYKALGLISFFTVGEDEVRAWTIARGTNARRAASKIHSSIERGFIRAEVAAYADAYRLGQGARDHLKDVSRLEGRTYMVHDGDIINFRFSV